MTQFLPVATILQSAALLVRHFVRFRLFFVFFTAFTTYAFGQETNCTDGIDNDGDRLIDNYDSDCACEEDKFFNKCVTGCQYTGTLTTFNFAQAFESNADVMLYGTPLVGDVDGDGEPEIVAVSSNAWSNNPTRWSKDLLVFDGASGRLERTISTPYFSWGAGPNSYVIGDIDNDGFGEVIINVLDYAVNAASVRGKLQAYDLENGTLKWTSDTKVRSTQVAYERFGGALGLADFNQDGEAEVYIYNEIFNAQTGAKLADGGEANQMGISQSDGDKSGTLASSIAADLTTAPGLEFVGGNTVYEVSIANPNGISGNSMTAYTVSGKSDGFTTVADIDLDSELDVIVSVRGSTTGEIYVYNPRTRSIIANRTNLDRDGSSESIGPPFI